MKPANGRVSASSLQTWEECPAKYHAEYVNYIPKNRSGMGAANSGTALHYALEKFVGEWTQGITEWDNPKRLIELYGEGWKTSFGTNNIDEEIFKEGCKVLKKWLKRTDLTGKQVLSLEKKSFVDITDPNGNPYGIQLTYIFDRCDFYTDPDTGKRILKVTDYKGLALDTPLPTPSGWSTMEKISVGDQVIGGDGKPCNVIGKSEIKTDKICYKLTFSDNTSIICDNEHRWEVREGTSKSDYTTRVMSAEEIYNRGVYNKSKKQRDLAITTKPVQLPHRNDLIIDPYVFGAWIGDGTATTGHITKPFKPLWDELASRDYEYGPQLKGSAGARVLYGLRRELIEEGVLGNKHIPDKYLRSSYSQRLELLRGIMDTDGYWNPIRQRAVLNTTNKHYAEQVYELVVSLGWTATIFNVDAHGFDRVWDSWQLWFTPTGENIFLTRQPNDYRPKSVRAFRRMIQKIEKIDTVPTQCIMVDSPSHTFLAGKQMVKTHNSYIIRRTHEDMQKMLQPLIYATASLIEYQSYQPDEIWVVLDLLRHDETVGMKFTRADCVRGWTYLQKTVEDILASDENNPEYRLGSGCRFCPIKATCPELQKNSQLGGSFGNLANADISELVKLRDQYKATVDAYTNLLSDCDEQIFQHAKEHDASAWETDEFEVKLTTTGRRKITDMELVAKILGPEIMEREGKINVTDIDRLEKDGQITKEQAQKVQVFVEKQYGAPSIKVTKRQEFE